MTVTQLGLVTLLSMLGATAHGSVGIGYGLVAGAGLVAIDPGFVPGPLLVIGLVVGVRHLIAEWDHIEREAWSRCMIGLPFGLVSGLAVLGAMTDRALSLAIGAAIVVATAALLSGISINRNPVVEVLSGAASAFGAVTASLPGPPFVLAFSDLRPAAMRATSTSYMVVLTLISWAGLMATGNFGPEELELLGLLVPGCLLGLVASRYVRPHLERPWFRPLLLVMAGAGGFALVLRNL